ncbi:hypothetical protein ACE6H2_024871 [Prunus campanulata]
MSESKNPVDSAESSSQTQNSNSWPSATTSLFLIVMITIFTATLIYQLDSFDPAPLPYHELTRHFIRRAPAHNPRMLPGLELVGYGVLLGPEDVAYHSESGLIYTGCEDGWVKQVILNDSQNPSEFAVDNWVNTGGRPLGLNFGLHNEVLVCDTDKGLLNITSEGEVKLLTDEAGGVKFKIPNSVDVATDGMVYFTDSSYKYNLTDALLDIWEGEPHGRFMSYDPTTKETKVLVDDLYFANGVVVSPDQSHVIFCETPKKRCKKYYIQGEKKGSVETFIDPLPGMPDNIKYDGEGHYWIALPVPPTPTWDLAVRYPFTRKVLGIMEKYTTGIPSTQEDGGILEVDLEGNLISYYFDQELTEVSGAIRIGNHIFGGSLHNPYILSFDIQENPAIDVA